MNREKTSIEIINEYVEQLRTEGKLTEGSEKEKAETQYIQEYRKQKLKERNENC